MAKNYSPAINELFVNINRLDSKIDKEFYELINPPSGTTIINGNFDVMDNINVSSNMTVNNDIVVKSNGNIWKNVDVGGNINAHEKLEVFGNIHAKKDIILDGNFTLNNGGTCTINGTTILNNTIIRSQDNSVFSGLKLDGNQTGNFLQMEPDGTVRYTNLDDIGLVQLHESEGTNQIKLVKVPGGGSSDDAFYFYLKNTIDIGGAFGIVKDDKRSAVGSDMSPSVGVLNIHSFYYEDKTNTEYNELREGILNVNGTVRIGGVKNRSLSEGGSVRGKLIIEESEDKKFDGSLELYGKAVIKGNTALDGNVSSSGSLVVEGGIGIKGNLNVDNIATFGLGLDHDNDIDDKLIVKGCARVTKKMRVGTGDPYNGDSEMTDCIVVNGNIGVSGDLTIGNDKKIIMDPEADDVLVVNGSINAGVSVKIGDVSANFINGKDGNLVVDGSTFISNQLVVGVDGTDNEDPLLIIYGNSEINGTLGVTKEVKIESDKSGDRENCALDVEGSISANNLYVRSSEGIVFGETITGGAVKVNGGVNIAQELYVGGGTASGNTKSGTLVVNGGAGIDGTLNALEIVAENAIKIGPGTIQNSGVGTVWGTHTTIARRIEINIGGNVYYIPLYTSS